MKERLDPRKMIWTKKPKLCIMTADKVIIETEPNSFVRDKSLGNGAFCLYTDVDGSFMFEVKNEFDFRGIHDQCGVVLYKNHDNWARCTISRVNDEYNDLKCMVDYNGEKDTSIRRIGTGIHWVYYRISFYDRHVRMQGSFNGVHFRDIREFTMPGSGTDIKLMIYACSPEKTYFDCTFSGMTIYRGITEEQFTEGD